MPTSVTIDELVDRYDALLLDAYGVLVGSTGPLPGAAELIAHLRAARTPFFIVTNDASRLPTTSAARFARYGLPVETHEVITSGSLIADCFAARNLAGARCVVFGPADSHTYVREAGGVIVEPAPDAEIDVVIACDDAGYPFLETCDAVLSAVFRRLDAGGTVELILPNPDLIYPKGDGGFGFTAGAVAMLLEAGLERRYPGRALRFTQLGKPGTAMFERARRLAGDNVVMIGDQLETDIAGALAAGIDAALLHAGVTRWDETRGGSIEPTYLLASLVPGG